MFPIAVCGIGINKDTCDLLYFQFSVTKFQSCGSHFMCVCFPGVGRETFKELHLTETGTQSTKVPVVRFVSAPLVNSLCDTSGYGDT